MVFNNSAKAKNQSYLYDYQDIKFICVYNIYRGSVELLNSDNIYYLQ